MDLINNTRRRSPAQAGEHTPHARLAPSLDWSEVKPFDHFVQYYESDVALVDSVSGFIEAGLEADECCIVIATQAHRDAIEADLMARGCDLAALRERGQYVLLDAAETLSSFMFEGAVEPGRFLQAVGGIVAQAAAGGRPVRAFGEMVALLWSEGNQTAAIRLEELWNELAKTHAFCLFCAYPMNAFGSETQETSFTHICTQHSRVIPAESYAALSDSDEWLREISRLQQKAAALEAEITLRKEAEKALSQRERELSDLFENAIEGINKIGPDGVILWANRAELELLGYQTDEYIGHHIAEFHVDCSVIEEMLAKLLRGESLYNHPARLRCKDGSIKPVLIHSNAYFEEGQFLYTRSFTRDVSYLYETDLIQRRLAAIVDSADDAIIGKTLDGIITSWNKGVERIFGYTASEAIGRPKLIVFPRDLYQEEDEILAKLRRGERIDHFESVRVRKDGTLIDVSLTISPIRDSQGMIVGASTIARDITQVKRQLQELAELNVRLKRSMTETHHRVKNNLQLISALIDMQVDPDREMVSMFELARIASNVRALGVIHDVLTRAAKEEPDKETISVKSVLDQLLRLLQEAAGERRLTFACDDARLAGKKATALTLVTNELVANAMKHGKRDAEISLNVQEGQVILKVCDDGPGFPEGFNAENAAHTGLELVESMVKWDLHGKTRYESLPEGGGCVTVSFPLS